HDRELRRDAVRKRLAGDDGHTLRSLRENVSVGRGAGLGIALLQQQPVLAALARAASHARQRPAAAQLLARQPELELAAAIAFRGVAHGCPLAAIPQQHVTSSVLARRDRALEAGVVERMILDVDREALL